jgi:hypothetical protein
LQVIGYLLVNFSPKAGDLGCRFRGRGELSDRLAAVERAGVILPLARAVAATGIAMSLSAARASWVVGASPAPVGGMQAFKTSKALAWVVLTTAAVLSTA